MSKSKADAAKEKNIFGSDDDSEEEDEDYVPPEDKNLPSIDDKAKDNGQESSDDNITGIEAIKREKRKREVDDFFDEMTKEDPLMKKMQERRKRQNTGSTMGAYHLMGAVRQQSSALAAVPIAETKIP